MVLLLAIQSLVRRSTVQSFTPLAVYEILHPERKKVFGPASGTPESRPRSAERVTIELTITTMAISDEVTTERMTIAPLLNDYCVAVTIIVFGNGRGDHYAMNGYCGVTD